MIDYPIVEDKTDFATASRFAESYYVPNMQSESNDGATLWLIARLISLLTGTSFRNLSC